jgi:hypothetical protein
MPYGSLDSTRLSAASQKALDKAVTEWRGTRQISKPTTFLIITSYEVGSDQELALRQELVNRLLGDEEFASNVLLIRARNEEDLASKIARTKSLIPIQTLTLWAESRHAVSVGPIFRRKFGKALKIKKFKADFEFNHPWVSTSSPAVWSLRNLMLRSWFEVRKRSGRSLRKRLRFLFWS